MSKYVYTGLKTLLAYWGRCVGSEVCSSKRVRTLGITKLRLKPRTWKLQGMLRGCWWEIGRQPAPLSLDFYPPPLSPWIFTPPPSISAQQYSKMCILFKQIKRSNSYASRDSKDPGARIVKNEFHLFLMQDLSLEKGNVWFCVYRKG